MSYIVETEARRCLSTLAKFLRNDMTHYRVMVHHTSIQCVGSCGVNTCVNAR